MIRSHHVIAATLVVCFKLPCLSLFPEKAPHFFSHKLFVIA